MRLSSVRRTIQALVLALGIQSASAVAAVPLASPLTEALSGGKRGGDLTVLDHEDFENLDPGAAYFALDYQIVYSTQRPLYSDPPNSLLPSPDLAAGPPVISPDARTVTVTIRRGIRFSPPVNREVTSADVAYAIERGANPHVANPYIESYFGSVLGLLTATGGPIAGIVTPNRHEITFHLSAPDGGLVAQALQLPLTAPVPESYARRFDRHNPSDYAAHEVATGPYMLENNRAGRVLGIGYVPGGSATLVRNPNWRRSSDFRPAYLNRIHIVIGGDIDVIGAVVLRSRDMVENDTPAAADVRLALRRYPRQLQISPGAGDHYIAINNAAGPFANVDVRKALWAALDREELIAARGGPLVADVASHFLYPNIPGFEAAGGLVGPTGPQFDFDEHPEGDLAVAEKYMRLAGYPSGKYTGSKTVQVVGSTGAPAPEVAENVEATLKLLGFRTHLNLVDQATMYSLYCGRPASEVDVCPDVGWIADFGDGQATLDAPFNGHLITTRANNNWGQTNDPAINAAMTSAEALVDPAARAAAWAKIDLELVEDAAAIPYDWDKQPSLEGRSVAGVGDLWNIGAWDYSWTSLR